MPDLSIDMAVANRFISSLSKSLQALCHGCMDFDSGIEIVGHININIDSGSKVDYVLNEKVLKSNTNSMTFVSNSFLAEKNQPKQLRDGACSPVLELQQQKSSYHHSGFQHHRSVLPYASQSHVLRGAHKRAWSGNERDWRVSPKKYPRGGRASFPIPQPQKFQTGSFSETFSKQVPGVTDSIENTNILDSATGLDANVNIKTEVSDSENTNGAEQGAVANSLDQDNLNHTETLENRLNIKNDPDAIPEAEEDKTVPASDTSTDMKLTFLNPASESEYPGTGETFDNQSENYENYSKPLHSLDQEDPCASETQVGNTQSDNNDLIPSTSLEYGESENISSFPISYNEQGEGSGDGNQFDVIEIDDEDEDVKAMFQDSERVAGGFLTRATSVSRNFGNSSRSPFHMETSMGEASSSANNCFIKCNICFDVFYSYMDFKHHNLTCHGNDMPYICTLCGKGYKGYTGLYCHLQTHEGKTFSCTICDSKYSRKSSLKRHLQSAHKATECGLCKKIYKFEEFDNHVCD